MTAFDVTHFLLMFERNKKKVCDVDKVKKIAKHFVLKFFLSYTFLFSHQTVYYACLGI